MSDLESLAPAEALQMYLRVNPFGHTDAVLQGHMYRLQAFVQWCEEYGIGDLTDLSGRDLHRYRIWRQDGNGEGRQPMKLVALRRQLATLRRFLRFCGRVGAVPVDFFDAVSLPAVKPGDPCGESGEVVVDE